MRAQSKTEYIRVANVWRENKDRVIEETGTEDRLQEFEGSKCITKRVCGKKNRRLQGSTAARRLTRVRKEER
jgi:hypothetical protein